MNTPVYKILDWDPGFEPGLLALERMNIQGGHIKLEIVKTNFLSRARVFENYYGCMAITSEANVIGSAIGAKTKLLLNQQLITTGIGFDTKVHPDWRNLGIGRALAKKLYSKFFEKNSLGGSIMTAKKINGAVHKLVSHAVSNTWRYPFVYLTIPTTMRVKFTKYFYCPQLFSVSLFDKENLSPNYYAETVNGLGCFYTNKLYSLRIKKISWPIKAGIRVMKKIQPAKYAAMPGENDLLSFATLYNQSRENISGINEILGSLQSKGINQLMVCCQQDDPVYLALQSSSINTFHYFMVSDFRINHTDRLTIDVRCL